MIRIYISGCGGMLGEAFYKKFSEKNDLKCTDIDLNEDWLSYLDFRDCEAYRKDVKDFKPDWLFHLGAYTDLEYCENNLHEIRLVSPVNQGSGDSTQGPHHHPAIRDNHRTHPREEPHARLPPSGNPQSELAPRVMMKKW